MIDVSIIVTVFDGEKYLRECIESLVNQTFKNIELIFVDDGSNDNSLNILETFAEKDERIVILHQENQGAASARNNGMKVARGKYIIFLDCDDIFEITMIEKMVDACTLNDLDVVVCRSDKFVDDIDKRIECEWTIRDKLLPSKTVFAANEVQKDFFMCFVWWAWDKLYKKSFVDEVGLEFQNLRTTNDLFFSVCTMMKANRISFIDNVLVHHRVGSLASLSVTREKSWDCFYKALLKVREFMKNNALYDKREQDFINYSLHFSLWHLETLKGPSYYFLYSALRDEWFENLGISSKPEEYFYNKHLLKIRNYIIENDITNHSNKNLLFGHGKNKECYDSKLLNIYMRVKLYYQGYGLISTLKKIFEKLFC